MATRADIYAAIKNADAAGDSESVRKLGAYLASMPSDDVAPEAPGPSDHSAVNAVSLGAAKPIENIGRAAQSAMPGVVAAVDRVGAKLGFPATGDATAANNAARANNDRTGYQTLGNIIGTAPTLALPGGALVQGGAQGALLSDADTGEGLTIDTLGGAAFSKAGDAVARGVAGVIAPKVSAYTRKLTDLGINMTPGQIARASKTKLGNFIAGAEDKMTSLPVVGAMIQGDRQAANDQFNRAVTNRVLKPLGLSLPDHIPTGHDAVAFAKDAVTNAYQTVLPKLSGTFDRTFGTRVKAIAGRANLPAEQSAQLSDIITREVGQMFDNTGAYTGKALGKVVDRLDKLAAGMKASQNTYERDVGAAVGDIREQVLAMARRNSPAAAKDLSAAARAHAEMVRLERAAAGTKEGVFSPNQYGTAVRVSDRTTRKGATSRGQALGQDLSKAASEALPSKLGDSGTFTRESPYNPFALATGVAAAVPYYLARKGAPVVTRNAGAGAAKAGDFVRRNARLGALGLPPLLAND